MKPSILPTIIFGAMTAALLAMLFGFWQMGAVFTAAALAAVILMNRDV